MMDLKLRILMLNDFSTASGAEKITNTLINNLEKKGHQVYFIHNDNREEYEKARDEFVPDIFHQHNPVVLGPMALRAMKLLAPSVQTFHDYWPMCRSRHHYLFDEDRICDNYTDHVECFKQPCPKFLVNWPSPNVSRVHLNHPNISLVAVSDCVANALMKFGYDNVKTIHNGINLEDNHEEGVDEEFILCVAKHHQIKGDHLFARMAKDMPYRFVLAGGGKFVGVESAGLLRGKELYDLYRRASIIVMPSVWEEPNGLPIQESMQYAKPLIVFDVGGMPEYVKNFVVPLRDIEAAKELIHKLMKDPELRKKAGRENKENMLQHFTADVMTDKYEKLYYERLGF